VLIPKPGMELNDPSAYRPLCMLHTRGKIFKRILCIRLERELFKRNGLSEHQYGFRKQRSATDAISAVANIARRAIQGTIWAGGTKQYCPVCTLDVKNAFIPQIGCISLTP